MKIKHFLAGLAKARPEKWWLYPVLPLFVIFIVLSAALTPVFLMCLKPINCLYFWLYDFNVDTQGIVNSIIDKGRKQ